MSLNCLWRIALQCHETGYTAPTIGLPEDARQRLQPWFPIRGQLSDASRSIIKFNKARKMLKRGKMSLFPTSQLVLNVFSNLQGLIFIKEREALWRNDWERWRQRLMSWQPRRVFTLHAANDDTRRGSSARCYSNTVGVIPRRRRNWEQKLHVAVAGARWKTLVEPKQIWNAGDIEFTPRPGTHCCRWSCETRTKVQIVTDTKHGVALEPRKSFLMSYLYLGSPRTYFTLSVGVSQTMKFAPPTHSDQL